MLTQRQKNRVFKLIRALRSGKYQQCQSSLRKGNKFCCLGVACDVSKVGYWEHENVYCSKTERGNGFLTKEVQNYYGFPCMAGIDAGKGGLNILNDSYNFSFEQIAQVIEDWVVDQ